MNLKKNTVNSNGRVYSQEVVDTAITSMIIRKKIGEGVISIDELYEEYSFLDIDSIIVDLFKKGIQENYSEQAKKLLDEIKNDIIERRPEIWI